jgi:hypothetical protein
VYCGKIGGRLASFATNAEIDQVAKVLQTKSISEELWLGNHFKDFE